MQIVIFACSKDEGWLWLALCNGRSPFDASKTSFNERVIMLFHEYLPTLFYDFNIRTLIECACCMNDLREILWQWVGTFLLKSIIAFFSNGPSTFNTSSSNLSHMGVTDGSTALILNEIQSMRAGIVNDLQYNLWLPGNLPAVSKGQDAASHSPRRTWPQSGHIQWSSCFRREGFSSPASQEPS